MIKWIRNLKMAYKLVGGFGIVLVIFIFVMAIYQTAIMSTTNNFETLMDVNVAITNNAADTKALMKQCRINEKDFIANLDRKYLNLLDKNIDLLSKAATQIRSLANLSNDLKLEKQAKEITTNIETYSKSFQDLVSAYEKRGLSVKDGLRANLNKMAAALIEDIRQLQVESIYIQFLKLRQAQNDYLRVKDDETKQKVLDIIKESTGLIVSTNASEMVKEPLKEMISTYLETFNTYTQADDGSKEKTEANENLDFTITEAMDFLSSTYLPMAESLSLEIQKNEKNYLLYRENQFVKSTHKAIKNLVDALKKSNVIEDYVEEAGIDAKKYNTAFDELVKVDLKIQALSLTMQQAALKIESAVDDMYKNTNETAKNQTKAVISDTNSKANIALMVGLCAVILGILMAFLITRAITVPIIRAERFSKRISTGDFTRTLKIDQKDEIGILAKGLNEIISNLGIMFKDIMNSVNRLSSASSDLKGISDYLSSGADRTADKSTLVATAAEQMTANLNSIATAMEETASNVSMVAAATEETTSTINEIANNSEEARTISGQAVTQAKNASNKMAALGEAAQDIGKVTEAITEISEQTNLLALNATIEAARAGDAGKGFAVVANEIKELAKQTAQATYEIKTSIASMQDTTQGTVTEIEQIIDVISKIDEIVSRIANSVHEQSTAIQEISRNVAQASQGTQSVNDNVAQMTSVASQISTDVSDVNKEAEDMSKNSSQINLNAEELSELADTLKQMVSQFQV